MTIDPLSYYSLLQAYALPYLYGVNPSLISPLAPTQNTVSGFSQSINADQTAISGLGQLASALSTFQTTVQGFEAAPQVAPAQASSTNSTVASASALSSASPATYNVTVNNLAQAQTVESSAFADPNATIVGSGTITLQLGTYNSGTNSFTAGGSAPVSINVTNGSLNDIATAINSASAGVNANVVQDASGYHLVLSSASTGTANGFQLTVQDTDGNNTDTNGLSQIAFDPTAAPGAGQNLTQTQAALDASLSVNGVGQTSGSNTGVSIASDVTLNLGQAGSTTVNVTQNTSALQSAAQSFVAAYNSVQSTLKNLTSVGGALAGDPIATQLQQDLTNTYLQSYAGAGSFTGLVQIGITAQSDGTLTLDTNALQSAFATDPSGTVSLFNQAAQSFDTAAQNYTAPDGAIASETQTLQQDVFNQQTLSGAATEAASVSQALAASQYQSALQLGYQARIQAAELAALFSIAQPTSSIPSVGLPFSTPLFA